MLNPHQKAFNYFSRTTKQYWSHLVLSNNEKHGMVQQMIMRHFEIFMNQVVKNDRKLRENSL